ncbi:MAG: glycosyltransferase [Coriobacteriales bacterium]|nr:glycosyltransferase [Coriobacteriales bacterium]
MVEHKLANVLLEHNERFFQYPELYYRSSNAIVEDKKEHASLLLPNTTFDFSTYFNALSNGKWRKYTVVDNVHFRLEIKGRAVVTFLSLRDQPVGVGMSRLDTVDVDCDEFQTLEYDFPNIEDDLLAFQITTLAPTYVRNGYYYTCVDESKVRDVHLAIATTTFRKEEYISNNVALFKSEVLAGNDPCAGHVSMIVVDNGRTLDPKPLEGDDVWVFPNKNVGGSGGFARGMIEAKRLPTDEPVTHVLIMDDDVSLSSESVKRTFNLVSLINDEYEEGFVAGAMFSLGDQRLQIENLGYTNLAGRFGPVRIGRHYMNVQEEVVWNERELPVRNNVYAAFWYCCIPMTTIQREGLPLPLFIRYDDAEYGQRCAPRFMTMNGINVWHEDFDDRYSAYYERYCGTRNALIIQAASGVCANVDFFDALFEKKFLIEIKGFNYGSCELLLDAVEDFLKGPEFLQIEQCEKLLKEESAKAEKLVPLEELDVSGFNLERLTTKERMRTWPGRLDKWTHNGQRFTPKKLISKKPAAMQFNANAHPAPLIHFHDTVLVTNRLATMGAIRHKDKKRYRELMKRHAQVVKDYQKQRTEVEARWREAGPYLKSDEFWATYLELDKYARESE